MTQSTRNVVTQLRVNLTRSQRVWGANSIKKSKNACILNCLRISGNLGNATLLADLAFRKTRGSFTGDMTSVKMIY